MIFFDTNNIFICETMHVTGAQNFLTMTRCMAHSRPKLLVFFKKTFGNLISSCISCSVHQDLYFWQTQEFFYLQYLWHKIHGFP